MRTLAAGRFVAAGAVGAQRWVGPVLLWAVGLGVTFVSGGSQLTTLAQGAAWLFPTSAWLVVATINTEDAGQAAVTEAVLGGPVRARVVKLAVAASMAGVLAGLSVLAAVAFGGGAMSADQLALGATAHLACAAGGCAVGLLGARPLVQRPGWAVIALVLVAVLELAVPHIPPVRAVVDVLDGGHRVHRWPGLALVLVETLAGCVVLAAGALALGRRRS